MKKLIIFCVLMVVVAVMGFSASEEVQMYEYLYNAAPTNSAQLDILQYMAEARLSGAGEFYARALRRLVSDYRNIKNITDRNTADEQAILLSALLGAEKYTQAAADLWLVAESFDAPLVKAEALMSLGKIRATNFLPQVTTVLNNLNAAPTADRLRGERIAFGAIISLEKYQDPSGYLPVFFASIGWYSARIRDQAAKSLLLIADDPSPFIMDIIKSSSYDYATKYNALLSIEAADVDAKNKGDIAAAALVEGWRSVTTDVQLRTTLANMRKLAIRMINRYKTNNEDVYPNLEKSYTLGFDPEEKLSAIACFASLGTDESAERLSKLLMELNAKQETGNIRQEEEQMVREIIPALGHTKRPSGRAALEAVRSVDWTPAVKRLADQAIREIGN